jgi:hypothetical protein
VDVDDGGSGSRRHVARKRGGASLRGCRLQRRGDAPGMDADEVQLRGHWRGRGTGL